MSKNKKYLNIFILLAALGFLMFNDLGVIKLISIYDQKEIIENEINDLIAEQNSLINEIKLLETDPKYIERVAREEFYMAKPGEVIYRIKRDKVLE